jgi:hypothetical protein
MKDKSFYTIPFVWNKTLWVMTFATFALWIGLSGWFLYHAFVDEPATVALFELIVLNLIMLPTILLCEGLAPQRLEIGDDKIVILRRYRSVVLHRKEIKNIEYVSKLSFRGAIRTFGVGGLFGYYGRYYAPALGSFTLYATSFQNLYLIKKWSGESIVISCAEPKYIEEFIKD